LPWLDGLPVRLILPDLRGNGRSPREGLAEATFETFADDLDALRARLGLERWTVLGHSFGSYIAQIYALRYPQRVSRLVLVGSAPAFDYPEVIGANLQARATPEQGALLAQAMSGPLASDEELARGWAKLLPLYFHRPDPGIIRSLATQTRYSAPALWRGFQILPQFNTLPRLHELTMPVLLATGVHDFITPPQQGAVRLASKLPDARLRLFEDSGHYPFVEERGRFLAEVGAFLLER
jgi:proline iminopeptidase